eukprot:jgi/Picsp_1/1816/NSC_05283-R1_---NA---
MKISTNIKACVLLTMLLAFSVGGTYARKGKGPKGNKGKGPKGEKPGERPAGAGQRPTRGPPGLGIFADAGADEPTLLATLPKARDGTLGLAANGQIMLVFQNHRRPKNETTGPELLASFSETGESWSDSERVVIQGLPAAVSFVANPTLTSSISGPLMYFAGASDRNLLETSSAIHVATHNGGTTFTYVGQAFSVSAAVMGKSAVAFDGDTGFMVVPSRGAVRYDDDDNDENASPIVARKLLDNKKKRGKRGSNTAFLATGTGPASFGPTYINITLPQENRRNAWVGTLLSSGNQLVFYGSGPGPWPVVSSDSGATWTVSDTPVNYPSQDPSVLPVSGRTLIAAGVKKSRGPKPAPAPAPAQMAAQMAA